MDKFISFGWIFLIVAMAGDLIVSFILPLFYKGYRTFKMSISALGNPVSPVRIPFNIWMLLEGILFLLALPAIWKAFYPLSGVVTVLLMIFISFFAVGACILTCFFSVNESKDEVTAASKIHGAGSVIGFMLFLFVPLLIAILSFKSSDSTMGIVSIISFILSIAFFTLFVMSDKQDFKNGPIDNEGLWQRLNLFFMYLPLALVAIRKIFEIYI
ncbi:MAG: DUF998 domain-containing protein [Clostridiales bacterium]|nr:DUF998 domain-containing protein [Clostridiales bacterium]